jgi:hypothetical protein
MEQFKKITGYESYTIYKDGRIYSELSKRFIKGSYDFYGYKNIKLYKNEIPKAFKIHQLIAIAFIPNPDNKPNINHINGIKDDNRIENLEWCTQKENIQHAWNTGLNKTSNKVIKNIKEQGRKRYKLLIDIGTGIFYESAVEASMYYNYSHEHITNMIRGVRTNKTNLRYA